MNCCSCSGSLCPSVTNPWLDLGLGSTSTSVFGPGFYSLLYAWAQPPPDCPRLMLPVSTCPVLCSWFSIPFPCLKGVFSRKQNASAETTEVEEENWVGDRRHCMTDRAELGKVLSTELLPDENGPGTCACACQSTGGCFLSVSWRNKKAIINSIGDPVLQFAGWADFI